MALWTLEFAPTWMRGSRSCLLLSLLPLVSACAEVNVCRAISFGVFFH